MSNLLKLLTLFTLFAAVSLSSCRKETPDPCEGITCVNDGVCINGTCDCPTGYSGAACQTELTPISVTITKVVVSNYPVVDGSGGSWDLSTGGDPYIVIARGQSANYINQPHYEHPSYYENATGQTLTYTLSAPYTITEPNSQWSILLWDHDSPDPDDFMTGLFHAPNDQAAGFPASYILDSGVFRVEVFVTWNF